MWHGNIWRDGEFVYDDDSHVYTYNGVVVSGVSTLLTPIVDFGGAPREMIRNAAIRGTAVHLACELWDEGDLDEDALDPVLVPYLAGWKKFCAEFPCEWTAIEVPEYSEQYGFAGTPDRKGIRAPTRKRVKVDIKATAKLNDAVEAQLSLYDLLDGDPADELWSVRVTKHGTYERHVHPPLHALAMSLLTVNRWREAKGLKYEKW